MPNQIPQSGATLAAGGALLPVEYAETLIQAVYRENAVAQFAQRRIMRTRSLVWSQYLGRPVVGFVGEGAKKPITGASWGTAQINVKEIAAIVPYTNQLREDARTDPTVLIGGEVEAEIANVIDGHALGFLNLGAGAAAITTSFDNTVTSTTQVVEYDQDRPDGLAIAISQAMGLIERNGGNPNGAILSSGFRQVIRDARQTDAGLGAAQPVYGAGGTLDPAQGLRVGYSTNLALPSDAPAAGAVVAVVGDWRNAWLAVRNDINVAETDEATLDLGGGQVLYLWQQNMFATRWDVRVGFYANDVNRQFAVIVNAA